MEVKTCWLEIPPLGMAMAKAQGQRWSSEQAEPQASHSHRLVSPRSPETRHILYMFSSQGFKFKSALDFLTANRKSVVQQVVVMEMLPAVEDRPGNQRAWIKARLVPGRDNSTTGSVCSL